MLTLHIAHVISIGNHNHIINMDTHINNMGTHVIDMGSYIISMYTGYSH